MRTQDFLSASGIAAPENRTARQWLHQRAATLRLFCAAVAGLCLAAPCLSKADGLDNWHPRNSGVNNVLNAVGYGNGMWVVVGNEATLLSSPDGLTWTAHNPGIAYALNSIVFANNLFAVVGESGTILTSPDGLNWTARPSGTSDLLYDVSYGGGKFIAVSAAGTVVTSISGISWTAANGSNPNVYGVAYGNGKYVSVGGYYTVYWDPFFFIPYYTYYAVTYQSADGLTWSATSSGQSVMFSDVAFGNGKFVAVGDAGTLITSTDGLNWTRSSVPATEFLWNVAFGNNTYVVVGGQQGGIYTSTNSVNWVARNSGATNGLFNVGYGNGTFMAVGQYGSILQSGSVLPQPPPTVQMSIAGGMAEFSWPAAAGNFLVQETSDLAHPAWSLPPTNQFPVTVGDRKVVKLPVTPTEHRFYRLTGQ